MIRGRCSIPLYNTTENNCDVKPFNLAGDVISNYSYTDIVQAYVGAVEKFG